MILRSYCICGGVAPFYCASVGKPVDDDILVSFPSSPLYSVARLCVTLSVVGSFASMWLIGKNCVRDVGVGADVGGLASCLPPVLFVATTATLASVVPSISRLIAVTSALTVVPFLTIVPGAIILKLQRDGLAFVSSPRHSSRSPRAQSQMQSAAGYGFVGGGALIAALAFYFALTEP